MNKHIYIFLLFISTCSCTTTHHFYSLHNHTKIFDSPNATNVIGELNQNDTLIFDSNIFYDNYVPIFARKKSLTGYVYQYNLLYAGFRTSKKIFFPKYRFKSYTSETYNPHQRNKALSRATIYTGQRGRKFYYNNRGKKVYISGRKQ